MKTHSLAVLLFAAVVTAASAQTYTFTTLAGEAGYGSTDGTGSTARFKGPTGVAVDGSGNVFVADQDNHTIRRITPAGVVTTLAGSPGSSGSADGTGSAARFNFPNSVAIDSGGNVFVADKGNNTIRRITPAGVVTTLAGAAGNSGSADGSGGAARFTAPLGLAVDGGGNVFVTDSGNGTIRKITPAGGVTTFAGTAGSFGSADGSGSAARFSGPSGIAVDGSGNVFVSDPGNGTVRRITAAGSVTTLAGTPDRFGSQDGIGGEARFKGLAGITVDRTGSIFVADQDNGTIRQITATGAVTTLAGAAGGSGSADGIGRAAQFNFPSSVAIEAGGNLFVADKGNSTIRRVTTAGVVTTFAGAAGSSGSVDGTGGAARFSFPNHVAVDSAGNLFVADKGNSTVRKITAAGVVTTIAGTPGGNGSTDGGGSSGRFNFPTSVAVDGSGNVFVADPNNSTIRRITAAGAVTTLAGTAGGFGSADGTGAAARFNFPNGVAVDGAGNVFVADSGNNTIRRISPAGAVTTLAGTPGSIGSADGIGNAARFNFPNSVAVDGAGNVYVTDKGNSTIRRITPGGAVTTLAGAPGTFGSVDGIGGAARFTGLAGIAVERNGNLFVADQAASTIRRITTDGVVSTIAGAPGVFGSADGIGGAARFNGPTGIAVDGAGNLYVADAGNNTIRLGVPSLDALVITAPPQSQTVVSGATVTLAIAASGATAIAYQWRLNGAPIAGATSASYTIANAQGTDAGSYSVTVSNAAGSITSAAAQLTVTPLLPAASNAGRITNLSILTAITTPGESFSLGFVVGGSGTNGAKPLLVRGAGPALAALGVTGSLPDPKLELYAGANLTGENDNWANPIGPGAATATQLLAGFAQVAAFPFGDSASRDSALLASITAAENTVKISGVGNATGTVIAELYDLAPAAAFTTATPRLINVSVLKNIGALLTVGFYIDGNTPKTVLVRAIGPTLGTAPFNVLGVVADPRLELHATVNGADTIIAGNDNWATPAGLGAANGAQLLAAFTQVAAFQLAPGSRDAAILATLQPGSYTVQVSGVNNTSGVALVEVYEVP